MAPSHHPSTTFPQSLHSISLGHIASRLKREGGLRSAPSVSNCSTYVLTWTRLIWAPSRQRPGDTPNLALLLAVALAEVSEPLPALLSISALGSDGGI